MDGAREGRARTDTGGCNSFTHQSVLSAETDPFRLDFQFEFSRTYSHQYEKRSEASIASGWGGMRYSSGWIARGRGLDEPGRRKDRSESRESRPRGIATCISTRSLVFSIAQSNVLLSVSITAGK